MHIEYFPWIEYYKHTWSKFIGIWLSIYLFLLSVSASVNKYRSDGKNVFDVGWKMSGNVLSVQRSINHKIVNYEIPIENNLPSPRDRNQLGPGLISKTQEHSFSIRMIIFLCSLLPLCHPSRPMRLWKSFTLIFQFFSSVSAFPQKVFFILPYLSGRVVLCPCPA